MKSSTLKLITLVLAALLDAVDAARRVSPPTGALIVGGSGGHSYKTISAAVAALPNDKSEQSVFINPGTYVERVNITRAGKTTLYGYTLDDSSYVSNTVTITNDMDAMTAGSNDASGTVRVETPSVSLYNLNIDNTFGLPRGVNQQNQAIGLSANGGRFGVYGCSLSGYQDVLFANNGTQVYLHSRIEGAIDYIFGVLGQAYFKYSTLAVVAPANLTASGRAANDSGIYLFEDTIVEATPTAWSNTTGNVYFGRPWGAWARVVFKNTNVSVGMGEAMWNDWHPDLPNISNTLFAEYNTFGSGVPANPQRPNFTVVLTEQEANQYDISFALGSDWEEWVDASYL